MGKLSKVKLMLQSMLMEFNQVTTDKGILRYEGEEIQVNTTVRLIDEDGNESMPEDGNYYLGSEDGRTLVIENGTITEIIEREEEQPVEETEVNARSQRFQKVKLAFEESYAEKERQIIEAIRKEGYDGYLIEAGDDYAVVEVWIDAEMTYKYNRFQISWDEEGNVIVGEKQEVKPAFVPAEENVPQVSEEVRTEMAEEQPVEEAVVEDIVDEIKEVAEDVVEDANEEKTDDAAQRIADLEALVEELKARIKELESEPAAEPATEEFKKINSYTKTGDAKLDRLAQKLLG